MKLVKANFPFIDKETKELRTPDDEPFEMTEERLAEVRAVNAHLVYVVGDVEPVVPEEDAEPEHQEEPVEPVEPSEPEASGEDAQPTEPAEPVVPEEEVKPEEPKKPRARNNKKAE